MRKPSTLQRALVRFWVLLFLVASFYYVTSAIVTTEVNSGNEENKEGHDEEAKFKGIFHPKPIFKKPIPIVKPIPKPVPIVKPILKPIPVVKPIPIPVYKPIPKPIPVIKPVTKPFIVEKPIPIPESKKPIPAVEAEEFLKPKPLFKKPIPKLPFHPELKKPFLPPLPIPTP
ncbi:proline-rich extensin-like protein EPR1 [Gastrolobium bilobum]|uniref:proline-rich extensin-like protein EPR1 n=1 Tax=Gastrolobium bilobum TaxID=150636 RepID=UPI002AB1C12E|nr:proline-rich extensin-like protein EPR1 [Gastrolobium bilobum]